GEKIAQVRGMSPVAQNILRILGGNVAQTGAYGLAAQAAGQQFDPVTDLSMGLLFSTPQLRVADNAMNIKSKDIPEHIFENLKKEAKKYSSADDFIEQYKKTTVLHGGPKELEGGLPRLGSKHGGSDAGG